MRKMASNNHDTQSLYMNTHVEHAYAYLNEMGERVLVIQSGDLCPTAEVLAHLKTNPPARYDVNIPTKNARVLRMVGERVDVDTVRDYGFIHADTRHHEYRVSLCAWELTHEDGTPIREYDRKRNYERRVRDFVNACKRVLGDDY